MNLIIELQINFALFLKVDRIIRVHLYKKLLLASHCTPFYLKYLEDKVFRNLISVKFEYNHHKGKVAKGTHVTFTISVQPDCKLIERINQKKQSRYPTIDSANTKEKWTTTSCKNRDNVAIGIVRKYCNKSRVKSIVELWNHTLPHKVMPWAEAERYFIVSLYHTSSLATVKPTRFQLSPLPCVYVNESHESMTGDVRTCEPVSLVRKQSPHSCRMSGLFIHSGSLYSYVHIFTIENWRIPNFTLYGLHKEHSLTCWLPRWSLAISTNIWNFQIF